MKKLVTLLALTSLFLTACGETPTTPPETDTTDTTTTETTVTTDTQQIPPTEYTKEEVAKHNTKETCWSIIDGRVYDLTDWIGKHPGGPGNIMKICGADGTSAFSKQHKDGSKAEGKLDDFYKGMLTE